MLPQSFSAQVSQFLNFRGYEAATNPGESCVLM